MVIEYFNAGAAVDIYRRARARGRQLPPGLEYVDSWVDIDYFRCFQLMRTDDRALFDIWGWLAQRRNSVRYDRLYTATAGLGLRPEVRHAANLLCELQEQEQLLERQIRALMHDPRFLSYRKVFAEFGLGERVEALILSQIYPLENYFGENGKPEVLIRIGKKSGKPTRRCLSRRRFQKALGVSAQREYSGDSKKWRKAGPALCRAALWQWLFTRIEPTKGARRLGTETGKYLGEFLDYQKQHCPAKLARSRTMTKAADMLFRQLVKALNHE